MHSQMVHVQSAQRHNKMLGSSAYTARFKSAFERHSPNNTSTLPSLLRSAFITHMREHTADQEVLQSAETAMKRSLKMQSSDTYDLDTHIRATHAAMDCCHEFATSTEAIIHRRLRYFTTYVSPRITLAQSFAYEAESSDHGFNRSATACHDRHSESRPTSVGIGHS